MPNFINAYIQNRSCKCKTPFDDAPFLRTFYTCEPSRSSFLIHSIH